MAKRTKKNEEKNKEEDLLIGKDELFIMRHTPFIEAYLECLNGTLAWQETHPDTSYDVASQSASRLLRNVKIKEVLDKRFEEMTMSKKELIGRLGKVANATLLPFVHVEEDGHIYFNFKDPAAKKHLYLVKKLKSGKKENFNINKGEGTEEKWIEVELHDPIKAMELIGKYYALFTDKQTVTNKKKIKVTIKKDEQ